MMIAHITIGLLSFLIFGQVSKESLQNRKTEKPTVSYCELIKNAKTYQGKMVRVRATYRVGFEWAELYCADCLNNGEQTWVEFAAEECRGSKKIKGDRTLNVIFIGTLQTEGQYGHFGAYKNQFLVTCVESAITIFKDSPTPQVLPQKILQKTHCQ